MTTKRKRTQQPNIYGPLYDAVRQYVEALGGKLIVIGGVEVQEWPNDGEFRFRLAVRCTGRKPTMKEPPQSSERAKGKR
jgi:hypothetical protein